MSKGSFITRTPKTIPGLTLWLDAADPSTITIVTGVSSIKDKSGNGFNPAQATGSKQPAYTQNLLSGLSGIVFDGTDDNMATSSTSSLMEPGTGAMSIFTVTRVISGVYSVGKGRVNGTSGTGGWAHTQNSSLSRLLAGTDAPADIGGSTVYTLPQASATLKEWEFDGANLTYYNNGVQFGTTKTYSGNVGSSVALAIGGRATNDNYSNMEFYELVVYKTTLSADQILTVRRYLGNKWGIPSS